VRSTLSFPTHTTCTPPGTVLIQNKPVAPQQVPVSSTVWSSETRPKLGERSHWNPTMTITMLQLVLLFLLLVLESDATTVSGSLRRRLIDSEGIPIPETPESVYDVMQKELTSEAPSSSAPVELIAAETAAPPIVTERPVDPPTSPSVDPPT
jgi:hypothetical protein